MVFRGVKYGSSTFFYLPDRDYTLAFNKSQMEKANGKVLGLFAYSAMPDGIEVSRTKDDPKRTVPTLTEMSSKALSILSRNEKGFFLTIEAGLIDWAAHYNDIGLMLHELLGMNDTLNYVLDWAKDRDDTLIVVTADHTTGGFGISYSASPLPEARSLSGQAFKGRKFKPEYNFGDPAALDRIYGQELSYGSIFYNKFDALPKAEQTPANLAKLVNQYTRFPITEDQAARVLATEDNPVYVEGHSYLGTKTVPKLTVKDEFFVYQTDDNRQNLLSLEVAAAQNVVWNTGTHTATPVIIFTQGSSEAMSPFGNILHHTQLGQNLIDAVSGQ